MAQPQENGWALIVLHVSLPTFFSGNTVHMVVVDSGATTHMTNQVEALTDFEPIADMTVQTASGERIAATRRGNLKLTLANGGKVTLSSVLGVPELGCTLISIPKALDNGKANAMFRPNACVITRRTPDRYGYLRREKLHIPRIGDLYQIQAYVETHAGSSLPVEARGPVSSPSRPNEQSKTPGRKSALEAVDNAYAHAAKRATPAPEAEGEPTAKQARGGYTMNTTSVPALEADGNAITDQICYISHSVPSHMSIDSYPQNLQRRPQMLSVPRDATEYSTHRSPHTDALYPVSQSTYQSPISFDTGRKYDTTAGETDLETCRDSTLPVGGGESANFSRATQKESTFDLWHARLGHLNHAKLREIITKNLLTGIPSLPPGRTNSKSFCRACALAKSHHQPIPKQASHRPTRPLECIHIDVVDLRDLGRQDERHAILITDEFTSFVVGKPLTAKNQVFPAFLDYQQRAYNVQRHPLMSVQLDNGELAKLRDFQEHCTRHGIAIRMSETNTPQQNGIAERMNRTIIEQTRALLIHGNMPTAFMTGSLGTFRWGV
jgi:transposase InsO family protein